MKFSPVIAAVVTLVAAAGASAQEATYQLPQPVTSQTTRAAVEAQVQQAHANGTLLRTEWDRQQATPSKSTLSRAEVQSEARAAVKSGASAAFNSDYMGMNVGITAPPASLPHLLASSK